MDESDLRIVESASCARCGSACSVVQADDLLEFICPQDGTRHVITVVAPDGVPVPAGDDPLVGQALGPCRIVGRAGSEGGLPLYHGLNVALNQPHAVRVLPAEPAPTREQLQAFVLSNRYASAVRHAAVASVIHLAKLGGGMFAVADPLEGDPLDRALERPGRLAFRDALRAARALAEALAELHDKQIIHRNIGPKSVRLLPGGGPQLRNFAFAMGPSAPAEPHTIVGQAGYLAPEQAGDAPVDARADIYSFGALLYLLLAGRAPFGGRTTSDIIQAQFFGKLPERGPLQQSGAGDLADLVLRMLAPRPDERPGSLREVLQALIVAEGHAAEPAPSASAGPSGTPALSLDEAQLSIVEPGVEPTLAEPSAPEPALLPTLDLGSDEAPVGLSAEPKPSPPSPRPEARAREPRPSPAAAPKPKARPPAEPPPGDDAKSVLGDLVLATEKEDHAAGADSGGLPDVDVEVVQPLWKRRPVQLAAVFGVLLLAFGASRLFKSGPPTPPPDPRPRTKRNRRKRPTPEEKAERAAKTAFERLEKKAGQRGTKPEMVLELCDKFRKEHAGTSFIEKLDKIRADATAKLHEKEADEALKQLAALVRDRSKPFRQRMAAADAFLLKYAGTKAVEKAKRLRAGLETRAESEAKRAADQVMKAIERDLEAKAYGRVIAALAKVVPLHEGTESIGEAAAKLTELREQVARLYGARRAAAETLVAQYRFTKAKTLFDEPIQAWHMDAVDPKADAALALIATEARQLRAAIDTRRAALVKAYGEALAHLDGLLAKGSYEEAAAAARKAAGQAKEPGLRALLEGRAADADLLVRALDRVVAGAKVEVERTAKLPDKRVFIKRASGAAFKTTIAEPSRKGIVLDMPDLKGLAPWGELAPDQLIAFAQSAKDPMQAVDHVALGLLALRAAKIKTAYEAFNKALDADATGEKLLLGALGRHAGGFVHIPAGAFPAGPGKEQTDVPGFLLARTEVANAEYALFCRITKTEPPPTWRNGKFMRGRDEYPVTSLTWGEANAYAQWLGMRLPEAIEWEKAVRGPEGRLYPWGDEFDPLKAVLTSSKIPPAKRKPPRLYPVTRLRTRRALQTFAYPIYHLVGNVREWTVTPFGRAQGEYIVAGGSAKDTEKQAVVYGRPQHQRAEDRDPFTGFRLAWPR